MAEHWSRHEVEALLAEVRAEARAEAKERLRQQLADELVASVLRARPGDPAPDRPKAPAAAADAVYVYGVVPVSAASDLDRRTVVAGPLAAVVELVDGGEWSAEALRHNFEDLDWLQAAARRHDDVLRSLLPRPMVPFTLATLFSSEDRVREVLHTRRDELVSALARVQGMVELGVTLHADPQRLRTAVVAADTTSEGGGGTAYVQRRLHERRTEDSSRALARDLAAEAHDRLAELARDARRNAPRSTAMDEEPGWNLLNAAYLVPAEGVEEFDRLVGELHARYAEVGCRLRRTGPWPPFNFVGEDARL